MAAISPIPPTDDQPRLLTPMGVVKVAIVLILVLGSAWLLWAHTEWFENPSLVKVEVLSWVVLLSGPVPHEDDVAAALPLPSHPAPARIRVVFDPDSADFVEVPIHERDALPPGAIIPGPAIIVEDETSTVINRNFDARIDARGYIELTRR